MGSIIADRNFHTHTIFAVVKGSKSLGAAELGSNYFIYGCSNTHASTTAIWWEVTIKCTRIWLKSVSVNYNQRTDRSTGEELSLASAHWHHQPDIIIISPSPNSKQMMWSIISPDARIFRPTNGAVNRVFSNSSIFGRCFIFIAFSVSHPGYLWKIVPIVK